MGWIPGESPWLTGFVAKALNRRPHRWIAGPGRDDPSAWSPHTNFALLIVGTLAALFGIIIISRGFHVIPTSLIALVEKISCRICPQAKGLVSYQPRAPRPGLARVLNSPQANGLPHGRMNRAFSARHYPLAAKPRAIA